LYSIFDHYTDIYRLSRLSTLSHTFFLSFLGITFLFFSLILDDIVRDYHTYYQSFFTLFSLHFFLTATVRMILLTQASKRLKAGLVTFNTLLVGGNQNALDLYNDVKSLEKGLGNKFIGFIDTNGDSSQQVLEAYLPKLGTLANLSSVVSRLANRLQRRLMAQQNRSWSFDLEEGMLDVARLTRHFFQGVRCHISP
jgi:FlaA1/EpsC-like NDP-sugar epimerase